MLCVQIKQQVMYRKLEFSLDSLAVTASIGLAGPTGQQEGSHVLFPLSVTGSVSLCKLPYTRLPQVKAWISAEVVEVTATPQHLQLVMAISKHQQQWHSAPSDAEKTTQHQSEVVALMAIAFPSETALHCKPHLTIACDNYMQTHGYARHVTATCRHMTSVLRCARVCRELHF